MGWNAFGRVLVGLMLLLAMSVGSAMADGSEINGTVSYRERLLLPEGAVVTVQLLDVSLADAPARILGQAVAEGASPPYRFAISYDSADIVDGHRYTLAARIVDADGALLFITTSAHPVFVPGEPDKTDIEVQQVRAAISTATPEGSWLAEYIEGAGVIDFAQTTVVIAADGSFNGRGGCNQFFGKAEIGPGKISFGQVGSTKMACAPALMDQEQRFFTALSKATGYEVDAVRHKLILLDAAGGELAVFAAN